MAILSFQVDLLRVRPVLVWLLMVAVKGTKCSICTLAITKEKKRLIPIRLEGGILKLNILTTLSILVFFALLFPVF
jgi:hypothetical protein